MARSVRATPILLLALTACGGGGGAGESDAPAPPEPVAAVAEPPSDVRSGTTFAPVSGAPGAPVSSSRGPIITVHMDEGDLRFIQQTYKSGEKKSRRRVKRTAEGVVNHGSYVRWYKNGVVALEGEYVDGLQQGVFLERFDTGQMKVETPYLDGRVHGLKKEWSDIGFVKKEAHFEHGELHGPYATFLMIHEGGPRLPHITGQHERGRKVGPWTYHYLSSEKRDHGEFVDGAREGLWTTWNQDGSLQREVHYRADEYHGELIEYEHGVKVSTSTYDMGTASGPQILWYESGGKRLERTFVDGRASGPASTWYENGQLESRGELVDGEKEGAWEFWRHDGSPDPERSGEYEGGERVP